MLIQLLNEPSSAQQIISIEASEDATIGSLSGTTNYGLPCGSGSYTKICVSNIAGANGPTQDWTPNSVSEVFMSLINFDLSDIPPGSVIINATLNLRLRQRYGSTNHMIDVLPITSNWAEGSVYWLSRPNLGSKITDYGHRSCATCSIDVTDFIADWFDNPSLANGIALFSPDAATDPTYYVSYFSRHESTVNYRPRLEVTIAAEPANMPPTVGITNGPEEGSTITYNNLTFSWQGADIDGTVVGYDVDLAGPNSTGFSTENTSFQFNNLANGDYTFCVTAIDNDSAKSESECRAFTVAVAVPNAPPTVSITSGPKEGDTITINNPAFSWQGNDIDGTVIGYDVDLAGPNSTGFSTENTSFQFNNLANGNYTFCVTAIDDDGVESESECRAFTVAVEAPITPPTVSITSGPKEGDTITDNKPSFSWQGSDSDGTVVEYTVRLEPIGIEFSTQNTSYQFSDLADGNYTFCVIALDSDELESDPACRNFTVAVGKPVIDLPDEVFFPNVPVGSNTQTPITLINTGNASLEIFSMNISGNDWSDFKIVSGANPGSIPAGESHEIILQFQPGSECKKTASLNVSSNADSSPVVVLLSGSTDGCSGTELRVGVLTVTAESIQQSGNEVYTLSGNVTVENILHFTGAVVADLNSLTLSGNGLVFLDNIPILDVVSLYEGAFEFSVDKGMLDAIQLPSANQLLEMAGLPIRIDRVEVLEDGIRVEGLLELPDIMNKLAVEVTTLQITQSGGLDLIGMLTVDNVRIAGVADLESLKLQFDAVENNFSGQAQLSTKLFEMDASTEVIAGMLESVNVLVQLEKPVPIGTTGMSISGGGGQLTGFVDPPVTLDLAVSLVPSAPGAEHLVELENLILTYTFGTSLAGRGDLIIFGQNAANAGFLITSNQIGLDAQVDFLGIITGLVEASLSKPANHLLFEGHVQGAVHIPAGSNFPLDLVSTIVGLPYTIASTESTIRNNEISGSVSIAGKIDLTYQVAWTGSTLETVWDANYKLLNFDVFGKRYLQNDPAKTVSNRFEGRSLVVSPQSQHPRRLRTAGGVQQSFDLENLTSTMVVRVEGATATPHFTLNRPDGTMIEPSTAQSNPNIEWLENDELLRSYYVLQNPGLGEWKINLNDGATFEIDVFGTNISPYIQLGAIEPSSSSALIHWTDNDPDDDALIDLYIDTDATGTNGVQIASNLSEDKEDTTGVDSHLWSFGDMQTGTYYVYGLIEDSTNAPAVSYSPSPINVVSPNAPQPPTNLDVQAIGTTIELSWEPTSEAVDHIVYYSTHGSPNYIAQSFNAGANETYQLKGLVPGRWYTFGVTSLDADGVEGAFSEFVTLHFVSPDQNNAPAIVESAFQTLAKPGIPYVQEVEVFDSDGDKLNFALSGPPEMTVERYAGGNMAITWLPESEHVGYHKVVLKVEDTTNLADSVAFYLNVVDPVSARAKAGFDKPLYVGYGEFAQIQVRDSDANLYASRLDSIRVSVRSGTDEGSSTFWLRESQSNSGLFINQLKLVENESGAGFLRVLDGDSLFVEYEDEYPDRKIVEAISAWALVSPVSVDDPDTIPQPDRPSLQPAYPNPFATHTVIQFDISEPALVLLDIYDVSGRHITSLLDENVSPGIHYVQWDGKNVTGAASVAGVYFYRLRVIGTAGAYTETKKMVLLK